MEQALKASYERLIIYLLKKNFEKVEVDKTMFINRSKYDMLMTQIYVDDIVFEATSSDLVLSFVEEMKIELEMSIVSELTFFLGL